MLIGCSEVTGADVTRGGGRRVFGRECCQVTDEAEPVEPRAQLVKAWGARGLSRYGVKLVASHHAQKSNDRGAVESTEDEFSLQQTPSTCVFWGHSITTG